MTRHKRASAMAVAVLGTLALAASACGVKADGPPEIVVDRTACAHCGMLISEPAYAAAYRSAGREARVFDDIACLLAAARAESNGPALQFWFHDASTSEWIDGRTAVFVHSPALRTPMGGGFIAYGEHVAAERAAKGLDGRLLTSLQELFSNPVGPASRSGVRQAGESW